MELSSDDLVKLLCLLMPFIVTSAFFFLCALSLLLQWIFWFFFFRDVFLDVAQSNNGIHTVEHMHTRFAYTEKSFQIPLSMLSRFLFPSDFIQYSTTIECQFEKIDSFDQTNRQKTMELITNIYRKERRKETSVCARKEK